MSCPEVGIQRSEGALRQLRRAPALATRRSIAPIGQSPGPPSDMVRMSPVRTSGSVPWTLKRKGLTLQTSYRRTVQIRHGNSQLPKSSCCRKGDAGKQHDPCGEEER